MKMKNTVLLLGIFAILILIAAQVIIIRGVWDQQDQTLRFRYRELSQQAVGSLRNQRINPFDTVYFLLEKYSEKVVKELPLISDSVKIKDKKEEIFSYFSKVLNREQDLSPYLSSYFAKMGLETSFNPKIEISNLEIISQDTFKIFQNDFFRNPRTPSSVSPRSDVMNPKSSILVIRQHLEANYFFVNFDYYIDFSDKRKMILKEIAVSLGMSIFSILSIVIMFIITYRNLMEEKRMSNLKTDFINNMTHELKTPLATITVAGKTLEMEQIRHDDSKILETAKLIGKQSVHLNQLINMILEISMWERTEFQLDRKKVDIGELMNDIVGSFKTGAGSLATLSQKYNLNGVTADIDIVYFTTMINNLLSNAVKYSDKEPVIDIEGSAEDNNFCIRVSDNGIGISKTDQKHVFDKFYRASSGNIHKYKGLGLGLYYVKKIAVAHGGDVTVDSKPGKGSIFTVTIPY
ncbi:MAG TPA: HAMP domain-containing sensor histidine kinase [Bacteroidales bacterium]|nr:HAMP domain-containing sensor histidine kinase [Bacteroidales bacterium]